MPFALALPSAQAPSHILLPTITPSGFTVFTLTLSLANSAANKRTERWQQIVLLNQTDLLLRYFVKYSNLYL